jgi:glutamine---fructose-6-phosphate transaminase (isomerizing)
VSAKNESGRQQLLAEMAEQPAVISRVLERQSDNVRRLADELRRRQPAALVFAARGSSDNAATYARYLIETRNRQLTSLAAPSTVTIYGSGPSLGKCAVFAISQSGQSDDIVAYLRYARNQGALTVAVVNEASSPLAENADWVLECLAGPEVSVPATKTVTAQMTLLASLAAVLAGDAQCRALMPLPGAVERALGLHEEAATLAREMVGADAAAVVGRGFAYPAALEIALKLKETTSTTAEAFSAADFFHGPVALVDPDYPVLLVDVGGRSGSAALDSAAEVGRRGGKVLLVRAGEVVPSETPAPALALRVPLAEYYTPIVAVVLGQVLSVELAALRGLDPSHPRGLSKITRTK